MAPDDDHDEDCDCWDTPTMLEHAAEMLFDAAEEIRELRTRLAKAEAPKSERTVN